MFRSLITGPSPNFLRKLTSTIPIAKGINVRTFWPRKNFLLVIVLLCIHTILSVFCTNQLLTDTWGVSYLRLLLCLIYVPFQKKKKKTHKISRELYISMVNKIQYVFDMVNIQTGIIRHLFKKYVAKIQHQNTKNVEKTVHV